MFVLFFFLYLFLGFDGNVAVRLSPRFAKNSAVFMDPEWVQREQVLSDAQERADRAKEALAVKAQAAQNEALEAEAEAKEATAALQREAQVAAEIGIEEEKAALLKDKIETSRRSLEDHRHRAEEEIMNVVQQQKEVQEAVQAFLDEEIVRKTVSKEALERKREMETEIEMALEAKRKAEKALEATTLAEETAKAAAEAQQAAEMEVAEAEMKGKSFAVVQSGILMIFMTVVWHCDL